MQAGRAAIALSFKDGQWGAVSNLCNHVGGPLGEGTLDGDYLVCPWHYWKFHRASGKGEPGYEADCVPAYPVKTEGGRVLVDVANATKRGLLPHPPHALEREPVRAPGPCASPAFRRRRWMATIRAFPAPTICSKPRSTPRRPRAPRPS